MSSLAVRSGVQENSVFLGVWTDWSHGPIFGATLTLTQRNGGFLIAFIALFVTLAGGRFWTIAAFITHILQSCRTAQDGIYHQRQAILCNSNSSVSALWKLLRLSWAWRRHRQASLFKKVFPAMLLSFLTLSTFAIATIFSSRVATSTSGEVLVSSSNCGLSEVFFNPTLADYDSAAGYQSLREQFSLNYASRCYRNDSLAEDCPTYPRKNLAFNFTRNVACPFPGKERICRNAYGAVRLDSGYINSHSDLGINAAPQNRLLYRTVLECAPLLNEGYTRRDAPERFHTILPMISYFYGSTPEYGNATYRYFDDPAQNRSIGSGKGGISEYKLW
jgi:hypothetical protein